MFSLQMLAGGWQTGVSMAPERAGRLFAYVGKFYPMRNIGQRNHGRSAALGFMWCNAEAKRQAARYGEEPDVPQRLIQTFIKT